MLSRFSHVWLFVTPWTATCQAPLSSVISGNLIKFMSIESVILSSHLILCHPLSFCLQSFPALGSFPMYQVFTPGGQLELQLLPMKTQGWFPLGLTGLITLQCKGLSRVFSSNTIQKHQFFSTQHSLCSTSHIRIRLWLQTPVSQLSSYYVIHIKFSKFPMLAISLFTAFSQSGIQLPSSLPSDIFLSSSLLLIPIFPLSRYL